LSDILWFLFLEIFAKSGGEDAGGLACEPFK